MSKSGAPVVLVGGGVAAVAAARALRAAAYDGDVVMISDESCKPYDRPPLSKQYLDGSLSAADVELLPGSDLDDLRIDLQCGRAAESLDAGVLRLDNGDEIEFAALLVATGAEPRRLAFGDGLDGVHYLRTSQDADDLRGQLTGQRRLVVIGAGFIGLEVAATARTAGHDVTVVEPTVAPLTRVLGEAEGNRVAELHRAEGVDVLCETSVVAIEGDPRVTGVRVSGPDGELVLPADAVVVGVGASPRTDWLAGSGVEVNDGVVCDDIGHTSLPGVYAAGDCSRWVNGLSGDHRRIEQWQAAVEQGAIAGASMAADLLGAESPAAGWSSVPYFWSDQFGHKLQLCGQTGPVSHTVTTPRGWVTCYSDASRSKLVGVFAVNGPALLARGRRHVAVAMEWDAALGWMASW